MKRLFLPAWAAAAAACTQHCNISAPECRGECPCGWVGSDTICSLFSTPQRMHALYRPRPNTILAEGLLDVELADQTTDGYLYATAQGGCQQIPASMLTSPWFCHGPYPQPTWGEPCALPTCMPNWAPGSCAQLGYGELVSTSANATGQTDPRKCAFKSWGAALPVSQSRTQWVKDTVKDRSSSCFKSGIYADQHDGDQKKLSVSASGGVIIIEPHQNKQSWSINASVDLKTCTASVDFRVQGKPNPPPVKLTANYFLAVAPMRSEGRSVIVFTDPSGTLGSPDLPLNTWVQYGGPIA